MSNSSTPQPGSGYASPIITGTPPPARPKAKPTNVFSNDGSFLERFQRTKKEEEEKRKEQESLEKKRNFDNRFKNRGKRPLPDSTHDSEPAPDDLIAKKMKPDGTPTAAYERELKTFDGRSLKDSGTGRYEMPDIPMFCRGFLCYTVLKLYNILLSSACYMIVDEGDLNAGTLVTNVTNVQKSRA